MEKKELKMYEAPAVETVEMETQVIICASNDEPDSPWDPGDSQSPW